METRVPSVTYLQKKTTSCYPPTGCFKVLQGPGECFVTHAYLEPIFPEEGGHTPEDNHPAAGQRSYNHCAFYPPPAPIHLPDTHQMSSIAKSKHQVWANGQKEVSLTSPI